MSALLQDTNKAWTDFIRACPVLNVKKVGKGYPWLLAVRLLCVIHGAEAVGGHGCAVTHQPHTTLPIMK
jgi:hypothetical protein